MVPGGPATIKGRRLEIVRQLGGPRPLGHRAIRAESGQSVAGTRAGPLPSQQAIGGERTVHAQWCRMAPRGIRLGSFEASPCHRGVCREVPSATIPRGVAERGPRVTRGRGRRKPSRASRRCAGESWSPPPGGWQWQVLRPLLLHMQMIEYSMPGLLGNADGVLLSARFRALACMLLSAELGWLWLAVVSRQLEMPIQCGTCPAGIDGR